jgi:hypothetical protein
MEKGTTNASDQGATMARQKRTAAQAYNEMATAITALMNQINDGLANHKRDANADPKNWGYVGDLGYYREQLREIVNGMTGEEG